MVTANSGRLIRFLFLNPILNIIYPILPLVKTNVTANNVWFLNKMESYFQAGSASHVAQFEGFVGLNHMKKVLYMRYREHLVTKHLFQ